jgi:RsiW-degrading membrane proteinase PrsW (M82 family)
MTHLETLAYSLLGGILPALLWLFFWLREDRKNPEPRGLIGRTFLLGMVAVILVIPFQKGVEMMFPSLAATAILLWALLEEVFKFGAGYFGGLHSVEDNEPLDPLIYMITAALGFVALENALFIFGPLANEDVTQSLITGNMRFIGASLLHVVSSGIVGASLSFSFYRSRPKRTATVTTGLVLAIVFHFLFNLFILQMGGNGTLIAFMGVWVGVAGLLWAFEKAKTVKRF